MILELARAQCLSTRLRKLFVIALIFAGLFVLTYHFDGGQAVHYFDSCYAGSSTSVVTELQGSAALSNSKLFTKFFDQRTYVRSAFRVSDTEIRLSMVRHSRNNSPMRYRYGNRRGRLQLVCNLPTCLDPYSRPCVMVGYIGIVTGLAENDTSTHILISSGAEVWRRIQVNDVRLRPENHKYPHELGVCLQPVYLHTDYVMFVQFFEYWLGQGATKFLIYRQSYSREVAEILQFYQRTSNTSIELVDWSHLPLASNDTGSSNPNLFLYRLEVMLAIFDCLHRSRGTVKFMAQTDLDEMIYVNEGGSLLSYLHTLSDKWRNWASLSFASQRVRLPGCTQVHSPNDVNFDDFSSIELENYVYPRPLYTKQIHRPERSFQAHIHQQRAPDVGSNGKRTYKNYDIPSKDAVVLHFRRLAPAGFGWHGSNISDALRGQSEAWNATLQHRLKGYDFDRIAWSNTGASVLKTMEQCRIRRARIRAHNCHSVFACEPEVAGSLNASWVYANNSWVVVT